MKVVFLELESAFTFGLPDPAGLCSHCISDFEQRYFCAIKVPFVYPCCEGTTATLEKVAKFVELLVSVVYFQFFF